MGTILKHKRLTEAEEVILHQDYLEILDVWKFYAAKHNVKWVIDWGTLLGAVREGKIIRHDNDVDISIFPGTLSLAFFKDIAQQNSKFFTAFEKRKEFEQVLDPNTPDTWLPYTYRLLMYLKDPSAGEKKNVVKRVNYTAIKLDAPYLWPYKDYYFTNWDQDYFLVPRKIYDDISTIKLNGIEFPAPREAEKAVEAIYTKKWKTPIMGWGKSKYEGFEWDEHFMNDVDADNVRNGYGLNMETGEYRLLDIPDHWADSKRGHRRISMPRNKPSKKLF